MDKFRKLHSLFVLSLYLIKCQCCSYVVAKCNNSVHQCVCNIRHDGKPSE